MARNDGRIQPGQKLTTAISARAWNRAQDAADAVLGDRQRFGVDPASGGGAPYIYVPARNSTGGDVPRWGVMRIDGLELTAGGPTATGNAQFQDMPVVTGRLPGGAYPERWGVAVEPIQAGSVGRLAVAGVVQARVRIVNSSDRYVRVIGGDATSLVTGSHGEGMILWMESGVGDDKWALIRLGVATGVAIVQFDGSWALNATKTVTFFGGTDTVTAINRFASVGAEACAARFGAITRHGSQWHLIAAQCQ